MLRRGQVARKTRPAMAAGWINILVMVKTTAVPVLLDDVKRVRGQNINLKKKIKPSSCHQEINILDNSLIVIGTMPFDTLSMVTVSMLRCLRTCLLPRVLAHLHVKTFISLKLFSFPPSPVLHLQTSGPRAEPQSQHLSTSWSPT